jgi:hypothetical protein
MTTTSSSSMVDMIAASFSSMVQQLPFLVWLS